MWAATRSELVRLVQPRLLIGWFGLVAVFAALINVVMFSMTGDAPPAGPGVAFPDAVTLASPDGLVVGVSAASSMFGIVTLSFWAIATATDYSSGLIRLLVAAQPQRWKLLAGKVAALAAVTAVATVVATMVNVGVAPITAETAGIDTSGWQSVDLPGTLLRAWGNAYLAALVWGVIGLVLAAFTRNSAVAIALGAGWVLLVESIVAVAFDDALRWLPGTVLTAVAQGGNATLSHGSAIGLGAAYVAFGLGAAVVVFTRRDVTD